MSNDMSTDPLSPFIAALHAGRLRVWSIVVTIFGEAVQPRGGRAAMTELQAITDRLGIEGGALRTAMSRLAQDGWVTREREGRNSFYTLSELGRDQTLPASRRIYRGSFCRTGPWTIAVSEAQAEAAKNGSAEHMPSFSITRQVRVIDPGDAARHRAAGDLVLQGTPEEIPDWVHVAAIGPFITAEYANLSALLEPLTPEALAGLKPLDALAMRVLLSHAWRRLVLRHPAPPEGLTGPGWPGEACHAALAHLYPALLVPSEQWWATPTSSEGREILNARFR